MKKLLVSTAIAALVMSASSIPALAEYSAIAIGQYGGGTIASGYPSMESARAAAVERCRDESGGSCSTTTAEHDSWYFSAGYCNGLPYSAASPQGPGRADQLVFAKGAADGNYDCYIDGRG